MASAQEYRELSTEELEAKCLEASRELFHLRNEQKLTKKIDQPHLLRGKRRDVARMMTVLREKKQQPEAAA